MNYVKTYQELNEVVNLPKNGYSDAWLFNEVMMGKKDIHFLVTAHPGINTSSEKEILKTYKKIGFGILKVNKENGEAFIAYRKKPGVEKRAKRLKEIADSHGGYLQDKSPEEAKEIGEILDYSQSDIKRYIQRRYK